jgi:threonine dehydratase
VIWRGAARVIRVSEDEIKAAMRAYFADTHNVAEGAGATPLAAALKDKTRRPERSDSSSPAATSTATCMPRC